MLSKADTIPMFLPFIFAIITLGTLVKPTTDTTSNNSVYRSLNKTLILQLVNQQRKAGCKCGDTYYSPAPAVKWSTELEIAALKHSIDMDDRNYFSHTSSSGTNPGARITGEGYKWRTFGENIAMGYPTEKDVVQGWVKSPGHCKNIMNKNFTEMGVGR
ncbi:MAG TPA: CAP domain-containing protein, partial [Flavisolibacter sp.]|nr:CAP domain-containing protein [Flavisolibacter sp.]